MRLLLPACFNMTSKIIQNGLPPVALLFDGMRWLTIESHADHNAFRAISKFNPRCAIAKGIFDQFVYHHSRIGSGEIEPHAAILGFHS